MAATERKPADAAARERIATAIDTTMMVEAAAGTGKTTSLVTRMVGLVRAGKYRAPDLAAITFTRKAGAQLREKFQEALEKELKRGSSPQIAAAIAQLDRTFLGTTHAFCARLLRERPVEAGLEPDFRELDEQEARLHATAFWSHWWEARVAEDDPRIVRARRAGIKAANLKDGFRSVIANPDVRLEFSETDPPDLAGAYEMVSARIDEIFPILPPPRTDGPDQFEQMIRDLRKSRDSSDPRDPADQLRLLGAANHKSRRPVQMLWSDKNTAKAIGKEWVELVVNVIAPTIERWKEYIHGVALSILVPAAEGYSAERRRDGVVTFDDLLLRARDLLRDNPEVRRYFQARYRVILVDEFQDTDPLQAEILFYLTGEDTEEKNWRKLVPRPGSLFIVGDPKQSIYRFRRADITTYLDVRKQITECGGEIVTLSTNFRSTPAVCTFVNESFSKLFTAAEVEAGTQAQHVDLVPFREEPGAAVYRSITLAASEWRDSPDVATRDAASVAARIRAMVEDGSPVQSDDGERPARWGDFLLISWQRGRLRHYAEALEREGIPYEITGGKAFQESEELAALIPPLRAILEPDDAIPLVAFLRGRLIGVDDDALYKFRRAGGRFNLWREFPEGADPRIVRAIEMLRATANEARVLPPAAVIARLVDRLGLTALAASLARGETRSGNLALALSYARHDSSSGSSLSEIVELFEVLIDEPSEVEEMNIEPAAVNAVRLMNLHQVKGLEAPFVFLIDPTPPHDFDIGLVVQRGDENVGHLPIRWKRWEKAFNSDLHGQPRGWETLESGEKRFVEAEKRRLLYVAATRARQWLAIGLRRIVDKGELGAWRDLGSQEIPELELRSGADPADEQPVTVVDFEEARRELDAARDHSLAQSYSVLPITKLAHENQEELVRAEEGLGKGMSWGRVMHRLFEALLRNPDADVELLAANLLKDEERDAAERDEVLRTVSAVTSSPLWQRVLAADEKHAEVPFALEVPAGEVGIEGAATTLLHGTVDLVFREGETWFIVDYKSDSTKDRLEALVAYYAPQVQHYARFWSQVTKAETKAGLFFVDGCREEWVV